MGSIPSKWLMIGGGVTLAGAIAGVWLLFNTYVDNVADAARAEAIAECNTTQLEEELAAEQRKNITLLERNALLEEQAKEETVRIEEKIVYRDRIVPEIREVQKIVEATPDGKIREQVSPTTKAFLKDRAGVSDE